MDHFVELILELLFGLAKDTPDKKTENRVHRSFHC